jgi:hypothetical protein
MSDENSIGLPSPTDVAPPGPPLPKKPKRKTVLKGGRAFRRADEDVPGPDYLARMEALGARNGESLLAFAMRLAGIRAGRAFLLEYAQRCNGNMSEICRQIEVNRHNLGFHLKQVGLTTADILRFRNNELSY